MSLDRFVTGSPLSSSFPAPSDSDQWLAQEFADDLFGGSGELGQALSADDDKLFELQGSDSFPDALSDLGSLSEQPDDKQVVMAAAAAAGLNRNGIRRTAFSTGDLQALSVLPNHGTPSPPDPQNLSLHRTISAASVSAQPGLATVPEGSAMNASLSSGMPTLHYSSESMVPTEDLSNMSVEELQAELIRTRQAFHSAGMPMYANRQTGQPYLSHHGNFNSMGRPPYPSGSRGPFPDVSMPSMMTSSAYGGFYQDASGNMQPLTSQPLPSSSSSHPPDQQQTQMLQSYADALLYQTDGGPGPEGSSGAPTTSGSPQLTDMPSSSAAQQDSSAPLRAGPPGAPAPAALPAIAAAQAEASNRDKFIRRSQSAVELRSLGMPQEASDVNLKELQQVTVELTTPEGHVYKVGRMSNEERAQKILKYRQKRHERNFTKRIKYMCRKTLADTRPRVRGRFARNNDAGAVMPHETKKALAAKAKASKAAAAATASGQPAQAPGVHTFNTSRPAASQNHNSMGFNPGMLLGGHPSVKGVGQPFQGQVAAQSMASAPHAFIPMTQHLANSMQTSVSQMPAMQPLLRNGTIYPTHINQGYQYTSPMTLNQQALQPRQGSAPYSTQPSQAAASSTLNSSTTGSTDQHRTPPPQPM